LGYWRIPVRGWSLRLARLADIHPRRRRGNLVNHQSEVVVVQLSPDLAAVVERVCERWELTLSGEAPRGDQNTILVASRQGVPCVLKIAGQGHNAIAEAIALEAWNGNGAARLLEADRDHGALLLERLDPDRSLRTADLATAAEIAGTLIHELAVPAPAGLPLLTDIASQKPDILRRRQSALGEPVPGRWIDIACGMACDLAADPGSQLVHGDLHYDNILAGSRRPWLVIDPKPAAGNPEGSVASLMWDRIPAPAASRAGDDATQPHDVHALFATLTRTGMLHPDRARAWTIVQAVDYWLWGLAAGLTEDPQRCERLLAALDP
jgi:streptomycin 6-kinase